MAKNIILVGNSGVGKSSVAPVLARFLGYSNIDTDAEIVCSQQQKISTLFLQQGEEYFRELEAKLLAELHVVKNCVISTGAGLPCHGDNWGKLSRLGVSVYLVAEPLTICRRLLKDRQRLRDTPLLSFALDSSSEEEILLKLMDRVKKTSAERSDFFEKADITVDSNYSTVEFCALLIKRAIDQRNGGIR